MVNERTMSPTNYNSDIESSSNSRMSSVEGDVCFPTPNKKEESGIDYEGLEEYIAAEKKDLQQDNKKDTSNTKRRRRLSTMGGSDNRRYSMYGDRMMVRDKYMQSFCCCCLFKLF